MQCGENVGQRRYEVTLPPGGDSGMAADIPPSLRPTRDLCESPALLEGAHIL